MDRQFLIHLCLPSLFDRIHRIECRLVTEHQHKRQEYKASEQIRVTDMAVIQHDIRHCCRRKQDHSYGTDLSVPVDLMAERLI